MKNFLLFTMLLLSCFQLSGQCETKGDNDGDGLCNDIDPCPEVSNPNPVDTDGDGVYNACDNCLALANADQADIDGDGIGDACDSCIDPDRDGVCGSNDKCPGKDDNIDVDNDGIPDGCDSCIDQDRDDICDDKDDCIASNAGNSCDDGSDCTVNDTLDRDCNCEGELRDADGDGVCDLDDLCPGFDDTQDFDNDGIPDGCDNSATCRSCEMDESEKITICHFYIGGSSASIRGTCDQLDKYFDNVGDFVDDRDHCGRCTCEDAGDVDTDGDGICDRRDPCPNDALDSDGDGVCDSMDICPGSDDSIDSDADGIPDGCDVIEYCAPHYNTTWEWISQIELDGIRYANGQSSSLDMYNTTDYKLEKGQPHTLIVTPEFIDDIGELSTHIYIDINSDGDYEDTGELVHESRSLDPTIVDLSIDNWVAGTYRMRVITHYGRIHRPCQEDVEGEIEDLLIAVIDVQACTEISESFDYDVETMLEDATGGLGWSGDWTVAKESTSSQVSILEGSLTDIAGNRLGVLNRAGTSVSLGRGIDANLAGATFLSFSMLLERGSGNGSIDMDIGGVSFGVDLGGHFYLEDQQLGEISLNETSEIYIKIDLNADDAEEIHMWINPDDALEVSDAANTIKELGSTLESFSITINSTDVFVPGVHYIDEIRMGCDENFEKRKGGKGKRVMLHKKEQQESQLDIIKSELSVWPNPISTGNTNVLIQGAQATYEYQLSATDGLVVSQGFLLPGLNRLPVQQLNSGVYYMIVDTEDGRLTKKLVL